MNIAVKLTEWVALYPTWIYAILFAIIFAETGLVVIPFLPGDSLLFATGAIAAQGKINPALLFFLLTAAALCGDNVNYAIGHFLGARLFNRENSRLLNPKHLERTREFYAKHGGKTVIMARFVPVVRTFAPFVAGIGSMRYSQFIGNSVIGAVLWVGICLPAGYFFGNMEFVKKHFELVVVGIVLISALPVLIEMIQHKRKSSTQEEKE